MLSIFQPEISTLESEIERLQSQIAARQFRMKLLANWESSADGAIQTLQALVSEIQSSAPEALAPLKSVVLELFTGDDASNGNGNQPLAPTPQPGAGPDKAEIDGLAEPQEPAYVNLVPMSDNVAYMRRLDGEIVCSYLGFNSKHKAKCWGEWLTLTHAVASKCEARLSKRLTAFKYELKLWGLTMAQIEKLATCDLTLDPRRCDPDAPIHQPEEAQKASRIAEIEDFGVGDRVRSVTVKGWEYVVLGIKPDGFLDCERIGATPTIRVALHPGSVELVSKAVSEEVATASIQPPLEPALTYSLLEGSNLDQKWSVSRIGLDGPLTFLGSVSCSTDTSRWSHSRQPKYGQNLTYFPSKELAAQALANAFDREHAPLGRDN